MSGKIISMEEWQKAQFVDWATRFGVAMLARLPEREQKRVLKKLERAVLDNQQLAAPKNGL